MSWLWRNNLIHNRPVPRQSEGSACLNLHYKGSFIHLLSVTSVINHILLRVRHILTDIKQCIR